MKNNKGFSLVELIVVIAIMAILAAVAVIGVSIYVPKAQKQADAELVNDIIYAVTLRDYETQFASNGNGVVGYVVITNDKNNAVSVPNDNDEIHQALVAAFGENYANELRLSYDGWTDAATFLGNSYLESIGSSSYVTEAGSAQLLDDVQITVNMLIGMLHGSEITNENLDVAIGRIDDDYLADGHKLQDVLGNKYTGEELNKNVIANGVVIALSSQIADYSDDERNALLEGFTSFPTESESFLNPGNALVYFGKQGDNGTGVEEHSRFDDIANKYAALEALVVVLEKQDPTCRDLFNNIMDETEIKAGVKDKIYESHDQAVVIRINQAVVDLYEKVNQVPALGEIVVDYYNSPAEGEKSQAQKDAEAYLGIMSSVSEMKDSILNDSGAMNNEALFIDSTIRDRVNSFISLSTLDAQKRAEILGYIQGKSAVVVMIVAQDGVITCLPCPAEVLN